MRNIIHKIGDNTGGIAKFFFLPVEDIVRIPPRSAQGILQNVVLREGAVWFEFQCTRESLSFKEPESTDRAGKRYRQEIKGYIAKDSPEVQELLLPLRGRKFVCLYYDHNNSYPKLVGTKQYYLEFETELDTKSNYAGGTGRNFSFKGESAIEATFYKGEFEVSDTGVVLPPVQSGSPVLFMKENGDVIASLQPGQKLIIGSGFKLRYRIE